METRLRCSIGLRVCRVSFRDTISGVCTPTLKHKEPAVKHIRLDGQPEAVRQFVSTLAVPAEGAVLELAGQAIACVLPPPHETNGSTTKEEDWTETKNARRCALIDRKYAGSLTPQETIELTGLQDEMLRYRQRVAPLPLEEARRLHQELLAKARAAQPQ